MGWAALFGLVSLLIGMAVMSQLDQPFRRERVLVGMAYILSGTGALLLHHRPDSDGETIGLIQQLKDLTLLMVLTVLSRLYREMLRYRVLLGILRGALLISMTALFWLAWRYPASFSSWPLEDRNGWGRLVVGADSLLLSVSYLLAAWLVLRAVLRPGFRHRAMAGVLVLGFSLTSLYNALVVVAECDTAAGPLLSPLRADFFAALFLTVALLPAMPPFVHGEVRRLVAIWQRRRMRQKLRILLNLEILADETLAGQETVLRERALRAGVPEEDMPALLYASALAKGGSPVGPRPRPKAVRPPRPASLLGEEPGSLYAYVESSWRCALLAGQVVAAQRGETPVSPRVAELLQVLQGTDGGGQEKGSRP